MSSSIMGSGPTQAILPLWCLPHGNGMLSQPIPSPCHGYGLSILIIVLPILGLSISSSFTKANRLSRTLSIPCFSSSAHLLSFIQAIAVLKVFNHFFLYLCFIWLSASYSHVNIPYFLTFYSSCPYPNFKRLLPSSWQLVFTSSHILSEMTYMLMA